SAASAAFVAGCASDDVLGGEDVPVERDPPPGTTLVFDEVVLGRSGAPPIIVRVKSLGTSDVRLSPAPELDAPSPFRVSSAPKRVNASRAGEIFVRFEPTTTGTKTAELVVHTNDRALPVARYPLVGPAREPCGITATPAHQRFDVGDVRAVTIHATTREPCSITRLVTDSTLFELVDAPALPFTIAPGGSTTLRVRHHQRTLEAGVPIRRLTIREREGTSAEVSFEGVPPPWDCVQAFPRLLEVPPSPLGIPVRARIAVTNSCASRVYVLAGWAALGGHAFDVDQAQLPRAIEPFATTTIDVIYTPFAQHGDGGEVTLMTDDAARPRLTVGVVGRGLVPRALIVPSVDFGAVSHERPGASGVSACRSARRTLSISSAGAVDLVVKHLALEAGLDDAFTILGASIDGVAQDTGQWIRIPPGASLDVELSFRPLRLVPARHEGRLIVEHTGLEPTSRVALVGRAVPAGGVDESFVAPPPELDVLFVVDGSASMAAAIPRLRAASRGLVEVLDAAGADYHLAVTTADGRSTTAGVLRHCASAPYVLTPAFEDTAGRSDALDCALWVPAHSRATQAGLAAVARAVERALAPTPDDGTVPSPSASLLRTDVPLAVVIATNDEDQSIEAPAIVRDYLVAAKGRPDLVRVHAIAGPLSGPCADGTPWVRPGVRYAELVTSTNGVYADVCALELGPAMSEIAARSITPKTIYRLERAVDPRTLRVELDGAAIAEDPHDGWTFDLATNTVTLHGDAVPAPGATIRARSDAICEPR
ncbi:choice-of-anchor D domain-containing protein, partial [Myxococcota bacterium]|nr:choice-of-anchor D domain-containing protein [Myxococcota bacterium]